MTTLREQIAAKIAPVLAPIEGGQPAGADPSFEPDFERAKAEIDKLTSVAGLEPSWTDIRELGVGLLSKRAKDLRVAGWLALARTKLDGWAGLAGGLGPHSGMGH